MISLENNAMVGEVEVSLYGKDGILKEYRKSKNLTTTVGFQVVCDMMGQKAGQPLGFDYCGVGLGTTAPAIGDTTLESETARVEGGYARTTDTIWRNKATFGAGVGTGTIRESGMFNNAAADSETILCRQTFGAITKGASDTLVVTWQYTLS